MVLANVFCCCCHLFLSIIWTLGFLKYLLCFSPLQLLFLLRPSFDPMGASSCSLLHLSDMTPVVFANFLCFLLRQNVPGSPYTFSAQNLDSDISPKCFIFKMHFFHIYLLSICLLYIYAYTYTIYVNVLLYKQIYKYI